jgi:hypothetical protein
MTDDRNRPEDETAEICAICGHHFTLEETTLQRMRHRWNHEIDAREAAGLPKPRPSKFSLELWPVVL